MTQGAAMAVWEEEALKKGQGLAIGDFERFSDLTFITIV